MKRALLIALILALVPTAARAEPDFVRPYEDGTGFEPANAIDACVLAELTKRGITPSNPCSDEVFIRRVFIDMLGTLPAPETVRGFLRSDREDKRAALVDAILDRDEFADYWLMKWCDLLRVKAEFPINLWPNGVQAYARWLRDQLLENRPFDEFARDLLTSSGSNFRVPPVNFYRAVQKRSPDVIAATVALTFMGARFEQWPKERQDGMQAFFSRIVYKPTAEWKEQIVINDPAPHKPLKAVFPDGTPVTIEDGQDPRHVFADWLLAPENPWFAKAIANRVWSWLLGRGVVHEPDDIRPDNPPSNPVLLACLQRELIRSEYDIQHLFRVILNSRTYQSSPIPASDHPEAEALFAFYPVRRLDAEVILDALCRLDGRGVNYESQVPEPFTYHTNMTRSILLADGTITSPFLEMFGRPARDTGLESERSTQPTDAQRLYLLNSSAVQQRIQRSPWLRRIANGARRNPAGIIRPIYMAMLARDPTPEEEAAARTYLQTPGLNVQNGAIDLTWALINSKEFLYRH